MVALIVVVAVVVLIGLAVVLIYNRLVSLRNRAENAWSQVDVQLRRRYDLVPNLVETVKGYASHERATFEEVTRARTAAQQAQGVDEQARAEGALSGAIGRLFAVAEQYPQLRATENFQGLQAQLAPPATLALWERFLVYGIALGIAERVLQGAQLHMPEALADTSSI